jgi:hypothetical protein
MAFDYGEDSDLTSPLVFQHMYDPGQKCSPGALIERLAENGCLALAGHFPLSRYSGYVQPDKVIAFVREPLVRACSEYLHRTSDGSFKGSIGDFIETPHFQNIQACALEGLTGDEIVGITERYRESVTIINQRFGLRMKVRRENRGPKGGGAILAGRLAPALVRQFYRLNEGDVALYQSMLERFQKAAAKQE